VEKWLFWRTCVEKWLPGYLDLERIYKAYSLSVRRIGL
jgi:hypothetical protein